MKILIIGGFLGSGKTTMLIRIGTYYSSLGKTVGIIVNEVGEVGIDGDIISKYGLETKEITAGCICCSLKMSLRSTIRTMREEYKPDIMIIEPTGVAYPGVVRKEIELMDLPDDCEIMPLLTLFDGSRFKQIMKEIRKFAAGQIDDAEIIAVSKTDLVEPTMIPIIRESLRQMNPKAKITDVSSKDEESLIRLLSLIDETASEDSAASSSPGPAAAEKKPDAMPDGSLVMASGAPPADNSGIGSFAEEYALKNPGLIDGLSDDDAGFIVKKIMQEVHAWLLRKNPDFVGHVKLFLDRSDKTFRINLTAGDQSPDFAVLDAQNAQAGFKILVAASGIGKKELEAAVRGIVADTFFEKEIN